MGQPPSRESVVDKTEHRVSRRENTGARPDAKADRSAAGKTAPGQNPIAPQNNFCSRCQERLDTASVIAGPAEDRQRENRYNIFIIAATDKPHSRLPSIIIFGTASRVGIWVLMITFGASFGYTVMGRVSLLVGRLTYLFKDWLGLIS